MRALLGLALALAFFVLGIAVGSDAMRPAAPLPPATVTACGPVEWGGKP